MKRTHVLCTLASFLALGSASAQYNGPKVTITYLHGYSGPDRPGMEALVKKFNETHPNIVVRAINQPWATTWQQLGPLVAAGRGPDVVVVNEDVVTGFIARGALEELTPAMLASAKIDKSKFYTPLWNTASYQGKDYGVPVMNVAQAMYYNEDLMAKMGVTKVPQNREEFLAAAKACTTDKAGKKPGEAGFDKGNLATWGAGVPNGWMGGTLSYSVLRQNGANLVDKDLNAAFNTPAAVEAVQFLVDLPNKYFVAPANATEQSEIAAFRQGKTCFNFNGVWMLTQYKGQQGLNFGVAPLPRLGTKQDAAWGGSGHLALPKQRAGYDKNKRQAALEFMRWMTEAPQVLTWTKYGALPSQKVVADDKSFDGEIIAGLFGGLGNVYATSGYPWVQQVRGAWDQAFEAAILGKKTVKKALDDGVAEANKNIAEARQNLR